VQYFDGTKEFDITVTNFRVYSTTANTAITNFTNSCRDEALRLTYGMQTCFLQRDSLGVPSGSSFDRLQCDGVGYVDTGWIPDANSDFTISFAVPKGTTSTSYIMNGIQSSGVNDRLLLGAYAGGGYDYMRIGSVSYANANVYQNKGSYLGTISYQASTKTANFFINGRHYQESLDITFDQPLSSFGLGGKLDTNFQVVASEAVNTGQSSYLKVTDKFVDKTNSDAMQDFLQYSKPNIIAHKGFEGEAPENTLVAFKKAVSFGCTTLECDVSMTKDGVLVLNHDYTIDRTSDGTGNLIDYTYEELLQFDFGSYFSDEYIGTKITTFEELLQFAQGRFTLLPEIKNIPTLDGKLQFIELIKKYDHEDKVLITSFVKDDLNLIKENSTCGVGYILPDYERDTIYEYISYCRDKDFIFMSLGVGLNDKDIISWLNDNKVNYAVYTAQTQYDIWYHSAIGCKNIVSNLHEDLINYYY